MYLHLGQNTVVPVSTVIGIFDLDNTTGSLITRSFLNKAEKAGRIVNISEDLPKSFIICREEDNDVIYLSQLASSTLFKRSEIMRFD